MKIFAALAALLCLSFATRPVHAVGSLAVYGIPAGSKIFVEGAGSFVSDFTDAIAKKRVPLMLVAERAEADYVLNSQASVENQSFWKTIFVMPVAAAHASIELRSRTGRIVFAYAVDRSLALREQKSTAEACAKHLKEIIRYEDEARVRPVGSLWRHLRAN